MSPFESRALDPFGVEVNVDLSHPLNDAEQDHLRALFAEHLLVIARNQDLDQAGHRTVMSYLGPIPRDEIDQVGVISTDENAGIQGSIKLVFHSDNAYNDTPDVAVSLHAKELTNGASSTLFASGVGAYRSLPSELKERIENMSALNVWVVDQTRRTRLSEIGEGDPRSVHPVAWVHPVTGERFLYVTEMQTEHIIGLPADESEELIAELKGYLYSPENIYEHRWNVGDLAVWDNRAVQHARDDLTQVPGVRTLLRAVCATKGFYEMNPQLDPTRTGGFVDGRHESHAKAL